MRVVFHILIGAIAGFALGVLAPIAMYAFMWWKNPEAMRHGGGGAIPFLVLLSAPLGALYGAVWGYSRARPPQTIIKLGPDRILDDFAQKVEDQSLEVQRLALAEVAPLWMAEYRRWVNARLVLIAVISFLFLRSPAGFLFWLILVGGYAGRTVRVIFHARSALATARERWGTDVIDRLDQHWTLRWFNRSTASDDASAFHSEAKW